MLLPFALESGLETADTVFVVSVSLLIYSALLTWSCSYSAVRRACRPQQRVQNLVDGTSYTGQSPDEAVDDHVSDPLTGRLEL